MKRLASALAKRNRAAQRVCDLEDALYSARQALNAAEASVTKAHDMAPNGTLIAYGGPIWSIVE